MSGILQFAAEIKTADNSYTSPNGAPESLKRIASCDCESELRSRWPFTPEALAGDNRKMR